MNLNKNQLVIILIFIGVTVALVGIPALGAQLGLWNGGGHGAVSATGSIDVYKSDGATLCTVVEFGTGPPGANLNQTVIVKNKGNVAVTLAFTSNSPFSLTWDYGGTVASGASKTIKMTWHIPGSAVVADHDFDIQFTSSG